METAGSKWATERVALGCRSISNGLTIPDRTRLVRWPIRSTRRARTWTADGLGGSFRVPGPGGRCNGIPFGRMTRSRLSIRELEFGLRSGCPECGAGRVAGDPNGWDDTAVRLHKRRTRSASVSLDPGRRYSFRYVDSEGRWFNDDDSDGYETNEFGDSNCIIDLTD